MFFSLALFTFSISEDGNFLKTQVTLMYPLLPPPLLLAPSPPHPAELNDVSPRKGAETLGAHSESLTVTHSFCIKATGCGDRHTDTHSLTHRGIRRL